MYPAKLNVNKMAAAAAYFINKGITFLSSDMSSVTKGIIGTAFLLIRDVGTFANPKEVVKKLISFVGSKTICCFSFNTIVPKSSN